MICVVYVCVLQAHLLSDELQMFNKFTGHALFLTSDGAAPFSFFSFIVIQATNNKDACLILELRNKLATNRLSDKHETPC